MRWRVAMAALGFVTGSRLLAAEADTPLSNTSQELREIRKEQGSPTQEPSLGNLRQALPQMQAPLPSLVSPEISSTKKNELNGKKSKPPAKNWLVDGVNKLEKDSKSKTAGIADSSSRAESTDTMTSRDEEEEPESLLKLYTEQKNLAEAEAKERSQHTSPQSNAFAPFLQNWLSDSRGHSSDKAFAESASQKIGGIDTSFQTPGAEQQSVSGDIGVLGASDRDSVSRMESNRAPAANPYLQLQETRILPDLDLRAPSSLTIPSAKIERQPDALVPNSRPETTKQKTPAPARSDDQKYFPQLKKF